MCVHFTLNVLLLRSIYERGFVMWRLLVIIAFAGAPAYADITHKLQSSVQLTVDAAATNATKPCGSSFAISGNGVDTTDGTTANTISAGTITSGVYAPGTISATQDTWEFFFF